MLSRWPIRNKLLICVAVLFFGVGLLAFAGFQGVYAYRGVARSVSRRATEFPLAAELTQQVGELRVLMSRFPRSGDRTTSSVHRPMNIDLLREDFRTELLAVEEALRRYKEPIELELPNESKLDDYRREQATVRQVEQSLARIREMNRDEHWMLEEVQVESIDDELAQLQKATDKLPVFLQERLHAFAGDVKNQYRMWIVMSWGSAGLALIMFVVLVTLSWYWVARPLRRLIQGSRQVIESEFKQRLKIDTHDEMSILAKAMNSMIDRFEEIRDDLDRQVKERTREVVRSEQMASVGFLAAGVAHEINNPLASIAWSGESLESRFQELFAQFEPEDEAEAESMAVIRKYLRRIQDEAFRCKGITDALLDYSRMGDLEKQSTDLYELTQGVIDMVTCLGKYRNKQVELIASETLQAPVNSQEIKQVMLNLITNGLDSLDSGGKVTVELRTCGDWAEIVVSDNGCGMTPEVLEHLFEPFFTRRRDGQGTGLGLSITYRIVSEHGGRIDVFSAGPGQGSRFTVVLPLVQHEKEREKRYQAA